MSLFLFSPLSLLYLTSVSPPSLALFSPLSSPPLILFVVFIHAGGDQGLKYSLSPDSSACARCTIAILASVPWRSSGRSWAWCSGRGAEKKSVKMRKMREMRDRWETNEKDWEGQSESHLEQHMMTHTQQGTRRSTPHGQYYIFQSIFSVYRNTLPFPQSVEAFQPARSSRKHMVVRFMSSGRPVARSSRLYETQEKCVCVCCVCVCVCTKLVVVVCV